jgi:type II secretory pathway pseudopilin PulG
MIELVIVVVIIGIIAAIAIPRMSRGAAGASDSALIANLAVLRNAIDLYSTEHGGDFPGATVENQLLQYSSAAGATSVTKDATNIFGPYLRSIPAMTVGAKKGLAGIEVVAGAAAVPPGADGTKAWWYNSTTGEIKANLADADTDVSGTKYNTY